MTHDTQHFHTWEILTHDNPCFEKIKELITNSTFSFSFNPMRQFKRCDLHVAPFCLSEASTFSICVYILTPGFTPLGVALYLHENLRIFFAWQVIRNVEVKCLTYFAMSHVINSYMIFFFFYFQLLKFKYAWNVKVAWNWSDARIFNVSLKSYHFFTGKIGGEFSALALNTNPQL